MNRSKRNTKRSAQRRVEVTQLGELPQYYNVGDTMTLPLTGTTYRVAGNRAGKQAGFVRVCKEVQDADQN